jgi:hypothetical protein
VRYAVSREKLPADEHASDLVGAGADIVSTWGITLEERAHFLPRRFQWLDRFQQPMKAPSRVK